MPAVSFGPWGSAACVLGVPAGAGAAGGGALVTGGGGVGDAAAVEVVLWAPPSGSEGRQAPARPERARIEAKTDRDRRAIGRSPWGLRARPALLSKMPARRVREHLGIPARRLA